MIDKIKDWFYYKYGVELENKHIWMGIILIFSILALVISLLANSGGGGNKMPPIMPEMPGATTGAGAVPGATGVVPGGVSGSTVNPTAGSATPTMP